MCVGFMSFVHEAFPLLTSLGLTKDIIFLLKYFPCVFICHSDVDACTMLVLSLIMLLDSG